MEKNTKTTIILNSFMHFFLGYTNNLPNDIRCLILLNCEFLADNNSNYKLNNLPFTLEKIYICDSSYDDKTKEKINDNIKKPFGCEIIYFDNFDYLKYSKKVFYIPISDDNKCYFNKNNIYTISCRGGLYINNKETDEDLSLSDCWFRKSRKNELVITVTLYDPKLF